MAWQFQSVADAGNYILLDAISGVSIDLFSSVSALDVQERMRNYADGWTPIQVTWVRGVFGAGETLRILARAERPVDTQMVAVQASAAVNSFWTVAGAQFRVLVSNNANDPLPDGQKPFSDTVKWVAFAAVFIAAAIVLVQIRKAFQ